MSKLHIGWKGIMDASVEKIEGRLGKLLGELQAGKEMVQSEVMKQVTEISDLVKDVKKIYSIKLKEENKSEEEPKSLLNISEFKPESPALRDRILDYFAGNYNCSCKAGEKGGQLECGHWLCLKCTAKQKIAAKMNPSAIEHTLCRFCGSEAKFRMIEQ